MEKRSNLKWGIVLPLRKGIRVVLTTGRFTGSAPTLACAAQVVGIV